MWLQRTTLALLVAALLPQAALAADPPEPQSRDGESEQPAQRDDDAATLERVVVTGEKLGRTAAETVSSVAIREGWQIDSTPANNVEDVIGTMANVGTVRELTIRGISVFGPTDGDGTTITVNVDGVAQESWTTRVDSLSVWDLDRIEVLRGPQSTNQGRSALAGAVVVRTTDPTPEWDFRSRVAMGSNNTWTTAVAGGGPLVQDRLAFRISGELTGTDGETYNRTQDDDRWDFDRHDTWRAKLAWTPNDDYRALLTLVDERHRYGHEYVEYTTVDPRDRISLANLGLPSDTRKQNLALEQTFPWHGLDITLSTGLANVRWERPQRDYDETELDQGASSHHGDDDVLSQEVRAAFQTQLFGHPLKGMAGVYYREQPGYSYDNFKVPVAYVLALFGMCPDGEDACYQQYDGQFILREDDEDIRIRNRAAFAEVDWTVGPLTWTLGARRDLESQRRVNNSTTSGNTPTAMFLVEQLLQFGVLSPDGQLHTDVDYAAWLPKLGVRWDLGNDWMLGAQWQRGYRTGGIVYSYQRGPMPFGPEFTNNIDVSLKGRIGERLLLAANAYRIEWRDQQVDVGGNALDRFIVNAGRSRLHGAELELTGTLTDTVGVIASLGVNRSEYLEFDSPLGDFAGNEFPMSPRHTAALRVNWHPGAWMFDAGLRREGATWSDAANDPGLRNRQVSLLDLKASYQFGNGLRAFAYATNLTDEFYTTWVFATANGRQAASLGRGRHVGMGLEWRY